MRQKAKAKQTGKRGNGETKKNSQNNNPKINSKSIQNPIKINSKPDQNQFKSHDPTPINIPSSRILSMTPSRTLFTSMPPHSTHLIHVHRAYVSPHDLQIRFLFPSPSLIVLTESRRKLRTEITPRSEPSMMKSSRHGVIADWNTFAVEGSTCDSGSSGRIGRSGWSLRTSR